MHNQSSALGQLSVAISNQSVSDQSQYLKTLKSEDIQKISQFIYSDNGEALKDLLSKYSLELLLSIQVYQNYNPIFFAIYFDKCQSLKAMAEVYGIDEILKCNYEEDENYDEDKEDEEEETNPIFFAIFNEKYQSLDLLIKLCGVDNFLKQEFSEDKFNPIFFAIYYDKYACLELFINVYGVEKILQQEFVKDKINPVFFAIYNDKYQSLALLIERCGVDKILQQKCDQDILNPVLYAIYYDKYEVIELIAKFCEDDKFLLQKYGKEELKPIFFAFLNNKKEIIKNLLEKFDKRLLLDMTDKDNTNLVIYSSDLYLSYDDSDSKKIIAKECLELLLKKIFGEKISVDKKISQLMELNLRSIYLRTGYTNKFFAISKNNFDKSKHYLEKFLTLEKIQIFKEVSEIISQHLNSFLPIQDQSNKENLYLYSSELALHSSYFIFHTNQENNKVLAITYLDGNWVMLSRFFDRKKNLINAITRFNLKPVLFRDMDSFNRIIKDFIEKSSKQKSVRGFFNDIKMGNIKFCQQKLNECKQDNALIISHQKRGNCIIKSDKILQRYLASKLYPKMSFETQTPEGKEDGRKLFKNYKNELRDIAIAKLDEFSKTLNPKDEFESFLLREKEILLLNVNEKISDKVAKKNFQMFVDVASRQTSITQSLKRSHALISSQRQELSSPSPTSSSNAGDQLANKKITKIPS